MSIKAFPNKNSNDFRSSNSSKFQINASYRYILEKLFSDQPPPALDNFKSQVKKLRSLVKKNEKESMDIQLIGQLKNKLERCRNPEFKDDKLLVFVDDDENEGKANDMAVETISTDDLLDF